MKRRLGILIIVAGALGLLAGACDDGRFYDSRVPQGRVACGQLTTCDVCTPVLGCGWCQLASGGGVCTDGPEDCPPPPLASWNWDPPGCHHDAGTPADASIGTKDSGAPPPPPPQDASTSSDASTAEDAASDAPTGG
jgi:hypothetical protein